MKDKKHELLKWALTPKNYVVLDKMFKKEWQFRGYNEYASKSAYRFQDFYKNIWSVMDTLPAVFIPDEVAILDQSVTLSWKYYLNTPWNANHLFMSRGSVVAMIFLKTEFTGMAATTPRIFGELSTLHTTLLDTESGILKSNDYLNATRTPANHFDWREDHSLKNALNAWVQVARTMRYLHDELTLNMKMDLKNDNVNWDEFYEWVRAVDPEF